jgi:predicted flap endonuclease-1-like 5' DNA nuclease
MYAAPVPQNSASPDLYWWLSLVLAALLLLLWWAYTRHRAEDQIPPLRMPDYHPQPMAKPAPKTITAVEGALAPRAADTPDHASHAFVSAPAPAAEPITENPVTLVNPLPTTTADETPDDLTLIEGIGPKINELLHKAGITTFPKLSATPVAQLRQILNDAHLRIADPGTWPEQAALAAAQKWDALKQLQDSLKGGKKVA